MEDLTPEAVERLRRSLAMLTPRQMALNREECIALLTELQRLREGLHRVIVECERVLQPDY